MWYSCHMNAELVKQLRAALSWELAPKASNPAYQASLELARSQDPVYHVNPLGTNDPRYAHLFREAA